MKIRLTERGELNRVMEIYCYAREQMKRSGNPTQWGDAYPAEETISEDIANGNSYVIEEDGNLLGVFSFILGEDPTYRIIEGSWKNDEPYGTIHRIASSGIRSGVFDLCMNFCEKRVGNLRIDTHRDNAVMLHLIQKHGFERCGIISVRDGSLRIAFQKVIKK